MKGALQKLLSLSLIDIPFEGSLAMLMTLKQRLGSLLVYSFLYRGLHDQLSQSRIDHPPGWEGGA